MSRGRGRGKPPHHLGAATAGQVHVEEYDVGPVLVDGGDRLVDVGRLGHHVDRVPQLGAHAGAEHRVVVDQHDADRLSHGSPPAWGGAAAPRCPHPASTAPCAVPPCRSIRSMMLCRSPCRSSATRSRSKPRPRSRTNTSTAAGDTSAYTSIWPVPGVLGGVGHRLAGGVDDGSQALSQRAVADVDDVDGDPVGVLGRGGDPAQRAGDGALVGGLAGVQPGPEVTLLGPGEPGDGGAVVGVLLDQGQRLEHRVVQVRGQVGALLGADPLGPLGGQVGGQAVDPRPDHDAEADHGQQRGDRDVAGHLEGAAAQREDHEGGDDQADPGREPRVRRPPAAAEHGPHRVDPAGGVQPALALRLVGLAPQQGDADEPEEDRPEHQPSAEDRLEQEDGAEAERGQRDRRTDVPEPPDPARAPAAAGRALQAGRPRLEVGVGGQHQPQGGVHRDADATQGRGHDERDPHPEHGQPEVPGQAAGDAADDRLLALSGGPADVAHGRGRGRGGCHDPAIVTQRRGANHEVQPRPDPDPPPALVGQDQGRPRWCPAGLGRRLGA